MKEDPVGKLVMLTQRIKKSGRLGRILPDLFVPDIELIVHVGRIISVTYKEEDYDYGQCYVIIPTFKIKLEFGNLIYATPSSNYDVIYGYHFGHVRSHKESDEIEFVQGFEIINKSALSFGEKFGENTKDIDEHHKVHAELLGAPIHEERACPDGIGRYKTFERGSIHYHPAIGAHETHGAIRDLWARENWEKGWLGYPVTDEQNLNIMEIYQMTDDGNTTYSNIGHISYFQNGAIYWIRDSDEYGMRQRPEGNSHNYARDWREVEKGVTVSTWLPEK